MANKEHLKILKQGVVKWNKWREEHYSIQPDLGEADLSYAQLFGANLGDIYYGDAYCPGAYLGHAKLNRANLREADLSAAYLGDADLRSADLNDADLRSADLSNADLRSAELSNASLRYAKLRDVDLCHAVLSGADLRGADLGGANLSYAGIRSTTFGDIDLSVVKGLETVKHHGPSTIGIDTIIKSQGKIPEVFLRKAGVPDSIIEQIPFFIGSLEPIQFYSCFISYSSHNQDFAERLYADLQAKKVRCWFAPEDMKIGDRIRPRLGEAIQIHDKFMLVLSEASVASEWVEYEVEKALARERKEKRTILFPIRIDGAVLESSTAWAEHIQNTRHIGDFTGWKDHDAYRKAFTRLLHDLKAEAEKTGGR